VDDDGVGLPGDLEETHLDSLGLNIVRSNVEFLSGRVKATVEQGTHFDIIVHEYEECSHMDL